MRRSADTGSATLELAVALPALTFFVLAGLSALGAVRTQLVCVDHAREVARAAARGGPAPPDPAGSAVTVTNDGDLVRATVRVRYEPLGGRLPGITVTATAVAAQEPAS